MTLPSSAQIAPQPATLKRRDIERFRGVLQHLSLNCKNENAHVMRTLAHMDAHFRRELTAYRKTVAARRSKENSK